MKSKIVIITSVFLFIIIATTYDNFYTSKILSGKYTYKFPQYIVEGPKTGDYLILKENGTFESDTWGNGTYVINGSEIILNYKYELGLASFECKIYRPLFLGKPRISVCKDLDYYFKRE
jgi:hypothetical protein